MQVSFSLTVFALAQLRGIPRLCVTESGQKSSVDTIDPVSRLNRIRAATAGKAIEIAKPTSTDMTIPLIGFNNYKTGV